ncbi:MAG: AgmX/PglI C-terminal domain-containing protein [Myxococcales bacterium]|nr:AgmX/PglI C-terminal domain-containing protein [Myxococcales bacterium]
MLSLAACVHPERAPANAPENPTPPENQTPRAPACDRTMPPIDDEFVASPRALAVGVLASSINKEPIRRVVREHTPKLRECYEEGLARDPALAGALAVAWTISLDDGRASELLLRRATLKDPCVVRCVLDELATMRFPEFAAGRPGEIRIVYPFNFAPR